MTVATDLAQRKVDLEAKIQEIKSRSDALRQQEAALRSLNDALNARLA